MSSETPSTSTRSVALGLWTAIILASTLSTWAPVTKLASTLAATGDRWLLGLLYLPGLLAVRAPAIGWVAVVVYAQWGAGAWLDAWLERRGRGLELSHVERIVAGQAMTAVIVWGLGMAGALSPVALAVLPVAIATGRLVLGDAAALAARMARLRTWRPRPSLAGAATVAILGLALAVAALATAHPVWLYDVLAYDFGTPHAWLQEGGFVANPHDVRAYAAGQAESQLVVAMAVAGIHGAQWLTSSMFVLLLVWVGQVHSLPGNRRIARLLLATTPVLLLTAANGKPDAFYVLYAAVASDRALAAADRGSGRHLMVAALAAGSCAATKLTALPVLVAPLALVTVVLWRVRGHPGLLRALAVAGLTLAAPLFPWVARNFAWTGNPLYPFATEWLGGPPWNAELLAADMHRPSLGSLSLPAFVRTLWQLTFASWGELLQRFGVFAVLGPAWLWLVPAALKKRALVLAAAAFVALSVLAFATTAWILRFAMVSLPMAALIVGQIRWANKPRWLRAIAAVTALTVVAANGTYAAREVLARTNGLALATTDQNDRGLLTAMAARRPIELGTYPLAAELARRHPDARVMVVGDTVHAYLDVRHTHASVFNAPAIQPYLATEDPARALAADGYTHILLNPTELARLDAFAGAPRLSAEERRQLEALVHALPCQLGDCSLASAAVLAVTPAQRRNVVLVSIDTLRADHLGCYGYPRATSPTLDRLARDGVRFANVSSTTSWTLPAHAALFTGLFDPLHGSIWDPFPLDPARVTLAEQLAARGYETAAVFTAPYLLPRFGLDQGFAEYHDATRYDKGLTGPEVLVASERGRTTDGALDWVEDWLARRKQGPFFLFVHLFDVHPDFDPPPPYATMFDADYTGSVTGSDVFHNPAIHPNMAPRDLEHLVALYDGEIRYVDEHGIARLARLLERGGLLDTTVLAVTADHGEEFFEHGQFGHRHNLHRETTRVPLILRAPGLPAGKTVDTFVRSIDVMPTLLDLAGAPPSPEALGESLVPLARGVQPGPRREAYLLLEGGGLYLEALEDGRAKTLVDHRTGQVTQYDLTADPGELAPSVASDEARRQLTAFRRVLAELRARLPRNAGSAPLDELTRQRLESLGYVDAPRPRGK